MAFLHIVDPQKRSQLVNEFLKTKRNIQSDLLSERLGDIEMKREFTKVFALITESQQKATAATEKGFAENQKAIAEIPKQQTVEYSPVIDFPTLDLTIYGNTVKEYLMKYLEKPTGDKTFGIYSKDGYFYIGNKEVKIDDNDIIIDEKKYIGTPGLWELVI